MFASDHVLRREYIDRERALKPEPEISSMEEEEEGELDEEDKEEK